MAKGTLKELSDLHGLVAHVLAEQIDHMRQGKAALDVKVIANAIKFLKDNNIECTNDEIKKMFDIKEPLPKFEEILKEESTSC